MNEDCLKLTTYFGKRDRSAGRLLADEQHGLVTSEMVPAVAALSESERRGGLRLASHDF